jgi:kynurenine formamidase
LFSFPGSGRIVDLSQATRPERGTQVITAAPELGLGRAVDQLPGGYLIAPLIVVDLSKEALVNADVAVGLQDLEDWEVLHGELPAGAIVVLRSGWSSRHSSDQLYWNRDDEGIAHHPGFSLAAVEFLVRQRRVRALGTDGPALAVDELQRREIHRLILGTDAYLLQHLTDLDRLPARGALAIVAPLKVANPQAPARVLALVERSVGR